MYLIDLFKLIKCRCYFINLTQPSF